MAEERYQVFVRRLPHVVRIKPAPVGAPESHSLAEAWRIATDAAGWTMRRWGNG